MLLNWLNQNQGAMQVLLTLVFIVFNLIFLYYTVRAQRVARVALQQSKQRFEQSMSPHVDVDLKIGMGMQKSFLLVQNSGRSSAYEVRITFEQDPNFKSDFMVWGRSTDFNMHDLPFWANPFILLPHREKRFFLDYAQIVLKALEGIDALTGKLTYRDERGKVYEERVSLDLNAQRTYQGVSEASLHSVVYAIEKMNTDLERKLR